MPPLAVIASRLHVPPIATIQVPADRLLRMANNAARP